jgi:lipoate-protein ligase A
VANGRKISGNGAAEIGDYLILVGNLIVDFDYEMMARVLRVPDEKFRDKLYQTIHDNLSTIRREIGEAPPREVLWDLLAARFADVLGPMEVQTEVDPAWRAEADALAETMLDPAWLQRRPSRRVGRQVTIRSGVQVNHKMHKAPGGLIRGTSAVQEGVLREVSLSGDFFFYPAEKLLVLESALAGVAVSGIEESISHFYAEHAVESPGVEPADLARVLG